MADDGDHRVEVIERDDEPAQHVFALLRLAQLVPRAPDDDLVAMIHVMPDRILEIDGPGPAVDQGHHVDAERLLTGRELVQLVLDHQRDGVALQFHDDAHPVAVALIA